MKYLIAWLVLFTACNRNADVGPFLVNIAEYSSKQADCMEVSLEYAVKANRERKQVYVDTAVMYMDSVKMYKSKIDSVCSIVIKKYK